MCCVGLSVEFGSDEFVGSESSGHVEVVVIISGGSSTTPIEVVVTPSEQSTVSARGEGYPSRNNVYSVTCSPESKSIKIDLILAEKNAFYKSFLYRSCLLCALTCGGVDQFLHGYYCVRSSPIF